LKFKPQRNLTRAYKAGRLKGEQHLDLLTTAARKLSVSASLKRRYQGTLKRAVGFIKKGEVTIHLKWVWLAVGLFLLIPSNNHVVYSDPIIKIQAPKPLKPLEVPDLPAQEAAEAIFVPQVVSYTTFYSIPAGSTAGNSYSPGFCTWFAKQMRPDLPNNLGNADTWFANAAAQGFSVGYEPRVGAVAAAISYMHVAIVTAVNGDGTITVSEMNYQGWDVVSQRTTSASEFDYIY
jgi:hypothetical protein